MPFALSRACRLLVAVVSVSSLASGADCAPGSAGVELAIRGATAPFEEALREELASELGRRQICPSAGDARSLARIEIVVEGPGGSDEVSVRIVDAVTSKTVERRLRVGQFPADGRALPVAIAVDELLRASWAEIALRPASAEVPAAVRQVVAPVVPVPPPAEPSFGRRNEVGVRVMTTRYGGGQEQLGLALHYAHDLGARWTLEAQALGRLGRDVASASGTVKASALGGALRVGWHVLRRGPLRLGPTLGVEASYERFTGKASGEARASSFGDVAVFGALGVASAIELAPVRVSLTLLALGPLRAVSAHDGTSEATAVSGPGVSGALGLGWGF